MKFSISTDRPIQSERHMILHLTKFPLHSIHECGINKSFQRFSFRYCLTYIDRYVITSGCVVRTGYFLSQPITTLENISYIFFCSTSIEQASDNFANKLSDSGLLVVSPKTSQN